MAAMVLMIVSSVTLQSAANSLVLHSRVFWLVNSDSNASIRSARDPPELIGITTSFVRRNTWFIAPENSVPSYPRKELGDSYEFAAKEKFLCKGVDCVSLASILPDPFCASLSQTLVSYQRHTIPATSGQKCGSGHTPPEKPNCPFRNSPGFWHKDQVAKRSAGIAEKILPCSLC